MPEISVEIPAAGIINQKIRKDVEEFYKERNLFHESAREDDRELETSYGEFNCPFAYAGEQYVSIVYEKHLSTNSGYFGGWEYVTRLYSSKTGDELQPEALFSVSPERLFLGLSFLIRKTERGFDCFLDDLFYKGGINTYYRVYYCITSGGLDIFFVEDMRTDKEFHFLISYREMADITKEEISGNILGYTLHRYSSDLWYEKDMDYLLDESAVGNGVYVSEETTKVITTKSQCIWGTWVVTEYWVGRSCLEDNDIIGKSIGIYPHSFSFGDKECSELAGYVTECIAIKGENEYFREIATFQELGMTGNYFLEFHPLFHEGELDIFPFTTFLLISSDEIMIPIASNSRINLEKVSDYDGAEDTSLMVSEYGNSICYGTWEIKDILSGETEIEKGMSIGNLIEIRKKGKVITSCKILDEMDAIIGDFLQSVNVETKNEYLVYYNFSDDYILDQMICIDDMTAIIIKEKNLFLIKRISNPVEDNVYNEIG